MSAPETEKPWIVGNWKIWQDAPRASALAANEKGEEPMTDSLYVTPSSNSVKLGDGMTLRDWFAGQALGAIVTATSNGQHQPARDERNLIEGMAHDAYELADALMAEREAIARDGMQ